MAGKGSAPGERRGGRQKGTPNKARLAMLEKIVKDGITPLDYMLQVMRTDENPEVRLKAALGAAPYVHPKLANIEVGNLNNEPFKVALTSGDDGVL